MVKKKIGGAHRYKALTASKAAPEEQSGPKPPQHLQKKITKKAKFFEKVAANNAALQVQRSVQKKKGRSKSALPNLQSLAGELDQLVQLGAQQEQQRPGKGIRSSIKRSKARLAITVSETQRLQQVLQHPTYVADPIQAITNHLTATMPAAPAPQKLQQKLPGSKEKKGKRAGAAGAAAMQE
eukprot:GHUV01009028.1.p1 GENE.GHUV01009028.1~~GHUV01009028.1.p1  ORF type:complete len:182 (+),score=61.33 GHUV01009028.1:332-877(+)